jgi:hypothetical protein
VRSRARELDAQAGVAARRDDEAGPRRGHAAILS